MYAQTFEGAGGRAERLNETVGRELLPTLRTERGFSGALCLVDHEKAQALVLVFWETEDQAVGPLPPYFAPLLTRLGVADPTTFRPRVWEVGARA